MKHLIKYAATAMGSLVKTGETAPVLVISDAYKAFGGGFEHRVETIACRYPGDTVSVPLGALSQFELIEFPEERESKIQKYNWVIAHWIVAPNGSPYQQWPVEAWPLLFSNKEAAYQKWDEVKPVWMKHGYFTPNERTSRLEREAKAKREKELAAEHNKLAHAGKLKPKNNPDPMSADHPETVLAQKEKAVQSAQLKVWGKIAPLTVAAIMGGDSSPEIAAVELELLQVAGKAVDPVDDHIVREFTKAIIREKHKLPNSELPSNSELSAKLGISEDATSKRVERLGLDSIRPRGQRQRKAQ